MKKKLIVITNNFPFGKGENFFDNEFNFLKKKFDEITIISKNVTEKKRYNVGNDVIVHRYNTVSSKKNKYITSFKLIRYSFQFLCVLCQEYFYFKKYFFKINRFKALKLMFHDLIKAYQLLFFIKKKKIDTNSIFYSYWLSSSALAISILKKNTVQPICIARGHRYDIYPTREMRYIPYRRIVSKMLDTIYFISKDGMNFFSSLPQIKKDSCLVSYLGTKKDYSTTKKKSSEITTIVSCSNLIPVKRIEKIIETLAYLAKDIPFQWIHFGDGPDKDKLIKKANKAFNSKIKFFFAGHVNNNYVQSYYSENYIDLFINLSSSEGIPVSIMEALSYEIPVVANDVGGISEIVNNENGILVYSKDSPYFIAEKIKKELDLSYEIRLNKRKKSFQSWDSKFNVEKNNASFYKHLEFLRKKTY